MRFDDTPDYLNLRQLFVNLFHRSGFTSDCIYDWNLVSELFILFEVFTLCNTCRPINRSEVDNSALFLFIDLSNSHVGLVKSGFLPPCNSYQQLIFGIAELSKEIYKLCSSAY